MHCGRRRWSPARVWLAAGGWLLPGQLQPPGRRAQARGGQGPGSPASPALDLPWTHTQAPSQLCGLGLHFLGSPRPGQGGESRNQVLGKGPGAARGRWCRGRLSVWAAAMRSGRGLRAPLSVRGPWQLLCLSAAAPRPEDSLRPSGWPSEPQGLALTCRLDATGSWWPWSRPRGEAALPRCPGLLPSQGLDLQRCRLPCPDAGPCGTCQQRL